MKQLKNLIISAIISIGFVSFLQILQPYSVTEVKLKLPKPIADETAEISDENVIVENPKPVKYQKRIEILAWNSYWLWSDFGFKLLPKCSYQNCNLTTDKKRIYTSDAILIHGHGFGDAKGLKRSLATFKNDYRPLIAYFNRESAQSSPIRDSSFNDLIDISMTYRQDSNIFNGYGRFVPTSEAAKKAMDNASQNWLAFEDRPSIASNSVLWPSFSERTKDVAWMVSHCQTYSKRENLVKNLINVSNLTIDIFGRCGDRKHQLPPNARNNMDETLKAREDMYAKELKHYKFYLSFENSLCLDYITEKFFLAFHAGVVPIVYGGKSKEDYINIAPPHSYINVEDFVTIQELGDYITYLSTNQTAYEEYFWWKNDYSLEATQETEYNTFCNLCKFISQRDKKRSKSDLYQDYKSYWNPSDICRVPKHAFVKFH